MVEFSASVFFSQSSLFTLILAKEIGIVPKDLGAPYEWRSTPPSSNNLDHTVCSKVVCLKLIGFLSEIYDTTILCAIYLIVYLGVQTRDYLKILRLISVLPIL